MSENELNDDIIEVENKELISYLESIGPRGIKYDTLNEPKFGKITKLRGFTYLWYKDINETWIISYYEIRKFFK